MKTVVFVSILLALVLCGPPATEGTVPKNTDPGTTEHLKKIFIGRCWDFQRSQVEQKDCNNLWKLFSESFAFKDPCKLTFEDYKPFFKAATGTRIDKILFWSGTYDTAHILSDKGKRFVTLEDTLAGYVVNGLNWCGQVSGSPDGINYDSCPAYQENCDRSTPFWGLASTTFAQQARGIATVLVNGTRGGRSAYSTTSFFARFELPNVPADKVTKFNILVAHDIGKTPDESCGEKSILEMQEAIEERGIEETCKNSPRTVKHILCTDHPSAEECLFERQHKSVCPKPFGIFKYPGNHSKFLSCFDNKAKILPCPSGWIYDMSPPIIKKVCPRNKNTA